MTTLYIVAALLCAIAIGILLWPLLRQRRASGRWSVLGVAVSFAIVPVAFGLYVYVSTWDPEGQQRASEGQRLVGELAARLERSPEDVTGWVLLCRSYLALGDYDNAVPRMPRGVEPHAAAGRRSQAHVRRSSNLERSFFVSRRRGTIGRRSPRGPARESEGAVVRRSRCVRAGTRGRREGPLVAAARNESATRDREDAAHAARGSRRSAGSGQPAAGAGGPSEGRPPSGPTVQLDVSLAGGLSIQQLPPSAALFILARAPGGGAASRRDRKPPSAVPGRFTLSDANSMIAGPLDRRLRRSYARRAAVEIGPAGRAPGDWYAQTSYRPKEGNGTVALVIDQVVQ